jgi:hypothetical protein
MLDFIETVRFSEGNPSLNGNSTRRFKQGVVAARARGKTSRLEERANRPWETGVRCSTYLRSFEVDN